MAFLVFDLGGTLMKYQGMPANWSDFYLDGFQRVNDALQLNLTNQELMDACEILRSYNPRICGREKEYSPEYLFEKAIVSWNRPSLCPSTLVEYFFDGLKLVPIIYDDTIPFLNLYRAGRGHAAILTDLPSAMPDQLIRQHISKLLPYFGFYVSSATCGYRKPNPAGLQYLAGKWKTKLSELCLIGDEEKDEKTAKAAGGRFIKIDRSGKNPQLPHNLSELSSVLGL